MSDLMASGRRLSIFVSARFQFTAAMLESARLHTDDRWAVARTRSGEPPTWLAGFNADQPIWVPEVEQVAIDDREGAERARPRCTGLPDLDDTLYAVCHLKGGALLWVHDNC